LFSFSSGGKETATCLKFLLLSLPPQDKRGPPFFFPHSGEEFEVCSQDKSRLSSCSRGGFPPSFFLFPSCGKIGQVNRYLSFPPPLPPPLFPFPARSDAERFRGPFGPGLPNLCHRSPPSFSSSRPSGQAGQAPPFLFFSAALAQYPGLRASSLSSHCFFPSLGRRPANLFFFLTKDSQCHGPPCILNWKRALGLPFFPFFPFPPLKPKKALPLLPSPFFFFFSATRWIFYQIWQVRLFPSLLTTIGVLFPFLSFLPSRQAR